MRFNTSLFLTESALAIPERALHASYTLIFCSIEVLHVGDCLEIYAMICVSKLSDSHLTISSQWAPAHKSECTKIASSFLVEHLERLRCRSLLARYRSQLPSFPTSEVMFPPYLKFHLCLDSKISGSYMLFSRGCASYLTERM